jgi:tRNA (pseudouridine54-N1)-methyltransferase
MRRFVVIGHRTITSSDFNLNDLCGSTGRLDVLLRCINSAFFLSHDMRRDVELYLILQGEPNPPKTIRLVGNELKYLNPDERSTAALIRNALMKKLKEKEEFSTPGIYISRINFEKVLENLSKISKLVYLREDGKSIELGEKRENYTFILGDHLNITAEEEAVLQQFEPEIMSLGTASYHSDHCIIVVNWMLDRIFE